MENDKKFFLKETDEKWKLKNCKLQYSYYAKTTQSNVVGSRASKWIHIDDLYPDYKEAMNQELNKYYYNKSITVWEKRYVQNRKAKRGKNRGKLGNYKVQYEVKVIQSYRTLYRKAMKEALKNNLPKEKDE